MASIVCKINSAQMALLKQIFVSNNVFTGSEFDEACKNVDISGKAKKAAPKKKTTLVSLDLTKGTGHPFVLISKKPNEYNLVRNHIATRSKNIVIEFPTDQDHPEEVNKCIQACIKRIVKKSALEHIKQFKASEEYLTMSSLERASHTKTVLNNHCSARYIGTKITLTTMDSEAFLDELEQLRVSLKDMDFGAQKPKKRGSSEKVVCDESSVTKTKTKKMKPKREEVKGQTVVSPDLVDAVIDAVAEAEAVLDAVHKVITSEAESTDAPQNEEIAEPVVEATEQSIEAEQPVSE